jgi:uncharacterized membrane protein YhaH (DUF805 family)
MENQTTSQGVNPYQAPQAPVADAGEAGEKQELKQLLFSFQGRISRKPYWLNSILVIVVCLVIIGILSMLGRLGMVLMVPVYVFYIWTLLALQVKRWHDRNKSGWWVLIALLPVAGPIWAFVEAGCLRGTEGSNNFGGDPTDLY